MGWTNQVVQASEVIIAGFPDALYVYNGTPGPNKLALSIVQQAEQEDPYGNLTPAGLNIFGEVNPPGPGVGTAMTIGFNGIMQLSVNSDGVNSQQGIWEQESIYQLTATQWITSVPTVASEPGGANLTVPEVWHNVTPPTNLTGTLRYMLMSDGTVQVNAQLTVAAAAAAGQLTLLTGLAAAYTPATETRGGVGFFTNGPTTVAEIAAMCNMRWSANTNGTFTIQGFPGGAATTGITELDFTVFYPLT
jgi:hypothetical protein